MAVFPYTPSMGVSHTLIREFMTNQYVDGYYHENTAEAETTRANGTKGVEEYRGINQFTIKFNSTMYGTDKMANLLWDFFITKLDNVNEPFYFYNPTECYPPDLTGETLRGRYYVKLKDPNTALSRENFRNCLHKYGLTLIETKEFEPQDYDNEYAGTIEIPWEMIDLSITAYGESILRKTAFFFNRDLFDKVQSIEFEVVATNTGNQDAEVHCWRVENSAWTVFTHAAYIVVPANSSVRWLRTNVGGAKGHGLGLIISAGIGWQKYAIQLIGNYLEVYTARFVVRQKKTLTKTCISYPMLSSSTSSIGMGGTQPLIVGVDAIGCGWGNVEPCTYFKWVPSRFVADTIKFSASMCTGIYGYTRHKGYLLNTSPPNRDFIANSYMLYDPSNYDGWVLWDAYTEAVMSVGEWGPTEMVANAVYMFRWYVECLSLFGSKLFSSRLHIILDGVDTFETYWRVSRWPAGITATVTGAGRVKIPWPKMLQDTVGNSNSLPDTSISALIDDGTNDRGNPAADWINKSAVRFNNTSKIIKRSSLFNIKPRNFISARQTPPSNGIQQMCVVQHTRGGDGTFGDGTLW